jgi:hypothetical protein
VIRDPSPPTALLKLVAGFAITIRSNSSSPASRASRRAKMAPKLSATRVIFSDEVGWRERCAARAVRNNGTALSTRSSHVGLSSGGM